MPDSVDSNVLRLLDANANRAREALRVLEDYVRFILDDAGLSAELKNLRHGLTELTRPWLAEAILHRNTPGDVGTGIKTRAELIRDDLDHVVVAAGKRLSEAMRSLEEFSKSISPSDAARFEEMRYRFYDLEQAIARTLRSGVRFEKVRLYVLITESACLGSWLEAAKAAIRGGADALQLREKDLQGSELLNRAITLAGVCKKHGVLFIVNDRPDIAVLTNADGVHVGQGDLPAKAVRRMIGSRGILGVSTHEIAQAKQAIIDGADYIGVGPIFRSRTKPRDWVDIPGLEYAQQVAEKIKIPAVAIAGINENNLQQVLSTGVKSIAVTAAVTGAENVELATRRLKEKLNGSF